MKNTKNLILCLLISTLLVSSFLGAHPAKADGRDPREVVDFCLCEAAYYRPDFDTLSREALYQILLLRIAQDGDATTLIPQIGSELLETAIDQFDGELSDLRAFGTILPLLLEAPSFDWTRQSLYDAINGVAGQELPIDFLNKIINLYDPNLQFDLDRSEFSEFSELSDL